MPRQLRVEYPGAMYHVMSRGDQREDIFLTDVDRHNFERHLERRRLEEVDEERSHQLTAEVQKRHCDPES